MISLVILSVSIRFPFLRWLCSTHNLGRVIASCPPYLDADFRLTSAPFFSPPTTWSGFKIAQLIYVIADDLHKAA